LDNYQSYATAGNGMGSYAVNIATGPNGALLKLAFPANNTAGSGGSQAGPEPFGKEKSHEPLKLSQITGAGVALSSMWSIGDADELADSALVKPGCALKPAHKTVRSFAYFDGHAATVKLAGTGANYGQYDQ
jgi:hypothetical protein